MPRRARVRSPRGAGVRPRRAALSTAASLRSNAVVVDGAPARRYCVIRFARHEPPRNGQRARQSGDTPNLVHPQFSEMLDYRSHVLGEKKHNRVSKTAAQCRDRRRADLGRNPLSCPLQTACSSFSSTGERKTPILKVNVRAPLPRATPIRDRERPPPGPTSSRRHALGQPALPPVFSSQGRLASHVSRLRDLGRRPDRADRSFCFPARGAEADRLRRARL